MICPNCRATISAGQAFCPNCAYPVSQIPSTTFCSSCGTQVAAGERFCPNCGAPVAGVAAAADLNENVTGRRIGAGLIDFGISILIFIPFILAFGESETGSGSARVEITGWPFVAALTAMIAYFTIMEAATSQTIGKMILGLQVVKVDGSRPSTGAIIGRNLLRLIDGLFLYLIAVVLVAVTPKRQRLGDMAAGTLVVRKR